MNSLTPYFLAIGANLAFGSASIFFSKFAKSHSPNWVNQIKVVIALVCFAIAFLCLETWVPISTPALCLLLVSGAIGLALGDFFLFKAFSELGATRTLVIYSFEPILIGIYGYFFLSQALSLYQLLAIACMMACVFTFVLERNRQTGKWHVMSFLAAFLGVFFDSCGVMLTRSAFELTPALGSFQANAIRTISPILVFILIRPSSYPKIIKDIQALSKRDRNLLFAACFSGTFLSLSLYLAAVKHAHMATLVSISITAPVWVSIIEHVRSKTLPNRYLVVAFCLFLTGFGFLTLNSIR